MFRSVDRAHHLRAHRVRIFHLICSNFIENLFSSTFSWTWSFFFLFPPSHPEDIILHLQFLKLPSNSLPLLPHFCSESHNLLTLIFLGVISSSVGYSVTVTEWPFTLNLGFSLRISPDRYLSQFFFLHSKTIFFPFCLKFLNPSN